jgi:hypothetical protein
MRIVEAAALANCRRVIFGGQKSDVPAADVRAMLRMKYGRAPLRAVEDCPFVAPIGARQGHCALADARGQASLECR